MNVLFFVEPLVMHSRPFHYWAWLDYCSRTYRAFLEQGGLGYDFRFVVNEALAERALAMRDPDEPPARRGQDLRERVVVPMKQAPIRALFERPNAAILSALHEGTATDEQRRGYAGLVADALDGFRPDVVITRTPAAFLREAFPSTMVLGTELGPFSRTPFPLTMFYDPVGMWARSAPAVHADELLARAPDDEERELLAALRGHYEEWFRAASPFGPLEARLRRRFKRLALLPLQFGGESGFDLNGPFRNQGEYLLHVLENVPADVAVLVVEHPTALWLGDHIDDETRAWVKGRFENVFFVDPRASDAPGQMLVPHVDHVISLSSSIGMQALFWKKGLHTVGWSHLAPFASAPSLELDPRALPDRDGALAWLLRHYYAPGDLALDDPAWIDQTFRAFRERLDRGETGLALFEPFDARRTPPLEPPPARLDEGLIPNGDFESWPNSLGPWTLTQPTAEGWEIVHEAPGLLAGFAFVTTEEGERDPPPAVHAFRLTRTPSGVPTLLLTRVPDLSRLAGAFVTLSFWARADRDALLEVYFYQQYLDPRSPPVGTPPEKFLVGRAWQHFAYTVTVPPLSSGPRADDANTEIVFMLDPDFEGIDLEITAVSLQPGVLG